MLGVKSVTFNPVETDSFSPQRTPQLWKLEGFSVLVTSAEDRLGVSKDGEEEFGNVLAHCRAEMLGRTE